MTTKTVPPNATGMLSVLMPMASTNACVSMVIMVTEGTVLTTTRASVSRATGMQYAETLKILSVAAVNPVFKAMNGHVYC